MSLEDEHQCYCESKKDLEKCCYLKGKNDCLINEHENNCNLI